MLAEASVRNKGDLFLFLVEHSWSFTSFANVASKVKIGMTSKSSEDLAVSSLLERGHEGVSRQALSYMKNSRSGYLSWSTRLYNEVERSLENSINTTFSRFKEIHFSMLALLPDHEERKSFEDSFAVQLERRQTDRLCFINRHFADLTELRDFKILIMLTGKTSMKSNMTICKLINLRDKNTFNCTFPPRHTCLQRSPRISLSRIMVGKTSFLSFSCIQHYSMSVANHVIYLRDRS